MTITQARQTRVRQALAQRLGSVVVVVEAVHRRHNVSAILRSAEAFGVHEIHMVTGTFRPSKGAARGAERWLEITRYGALEPCVAGLRERGFRFLVADFGPDAVTPDEAPIDTPLAILFGAELAGVSDAARALADGRVCIPTVGLTTSLNVSAAAAIVLGRLTHRRRALVGADLSADRQRAFFDAWLTRESESRTGMRARMRLGAAP